MMLRSLVPYNALMGVMSASPSERSIISSYRFFFAFLGALLLQGLMLPLLAALDDPRAAPFLHALYGYGPTFRYTAAMTFFSALALVLFVVTFATTRERVHPPLEQRSTVLQDA